MSYPYAVVNDGSVSSRPPKPSLDVDPDRREDQSIDYIHLILFDCNFLTYATIEFIIDLVKENASLDRQNPLIKCLHGSILYRDLLIFDYDLHQTLTGYLNINRPTVLLKVAKSKYPKLHKLTIVSTDYLNGFDCTNKVYDLYHHVHIWTLPCLYHQGRHIELDRKSRNITYFNIETGKPFISKSWTLAIARKLFKSIEDFLN